MAKNKIQKFLAALRAKVSSIDFPKVIFTAGIAAFVISGGLVLFKKYDTDVEFAAFLDKMKCQSLHEPWKNPASFSSFLNDDRPPVFIPAHTELWVCYDNTRPFLVAK